MSPFGKEVPLSLSELQQGMNRLFDQVWHAGIRTGPFDGQDWAPPLDLIEKPDRFVLEVEMPGLSRDDVEVTCADNQVTIKGQKTRSGACDQGDRLELAERRYGSFCRVVPLGQPTKPDAVSAKFEKGLLQIEIPKEQVSANQQVKIDISE